MAVDKVAEVLKISTDQVLQRLREGRLEPGSTPGTVDPMSVISAVSDAQEPQLVDLELAMATLPRSSLWGALTIPPAVALLGMAVVVYLMAAVDDPGELPLHPAVFVTGLGVSLGLLTLWVRAQPETVAISGMGAMMYGRRETEGGHVATRWLTFAGVPLLPARSYVVHREQETQNLSGRSTRMQLTAMDALCWEQVLPVLLGVHGALAVLLATLWMWS